MTQSYLEWQDARKTPLWQVVLMVGFFLALIMWLVVAASARDALWFLGGSQIPAPPQRIVIHRSGETQTVVLGDADYENLSQALVQSLSRLNSTSPIDIGLSEETMADYMTRFTVIEAYFPQPIRYHTPVWLTAPDKVLIPIQGRHAGQGLFFLGNGDADYRAGALRMKDDAALLAALGDMGIEVAEP
jgi:hypothetical protein